MGQHLVSIAAVSLITAASNRDGPKTLQCIQKVESCGDISELEVSIPKWDELDRALANALAGISVGEAARELLVDQEQQTRRGMPLTGRAAWWMVLKRFRLERGQNNAVSLHTLWRSKFKGDLACPHQGRSQGN